MTTIALPSVQSVLIELTFRNQPLATGTAFVCESKKGSALLTNWHNLAGRNPHTKQSLSPTGAIPDSVRIVHTNPTLVSSGRRAP